MSLKEIAKEKHNNYSIKQFHVAGKTFFLIYKHGKIMNPKQNQKSLVERYYNVPCHSGETSMKLSIGQYFYQLEMCTKVCTQYLLKI